MQGLRIGTHLGFLVELLCLGYYGELIVWLLGKLRESVRNEILGLMVCFLGLLKRIEILGLMVSFLGFLVSWFIILYINLSKANLECTK
jgi:hypothetical protein